MRTKLFIAFLLVIALALFSNLIFEKLIIKDFDEYVKGTREDHLYWLLAAIETSYLPNTGWNRSALINSLHWAMMLRFEIMIKDSAGNQVIASEDITRHLDSSMKRKMQVIEPPGDRNIPFEKYPLFSQGKEIGALFVRDVTREDSPLKMKEIIFKKRGLAFLVISFAIAGGGALILALLFSQFLSKPVTELKKASEAVAKGDLSVRLSTGQDEIGRLKAAFNKMAEALSREDSLRKQLTSNVAHELRTPLAVMKARLEAMLDGVIGTDRAELESLKTEMDSLARLIGGIEDLTKAEASFFKKSPALEINLHEFLSGMVEGFNPIFNEKGLYLRLLSDRKEILLTEPEKLEKVLRNIIVNALHYTATGGVLIDYGKEKGKDGLFFVKVTDTGKGIEASELSRIFDRFYKGKNSKGFGLGLAISKELIGIMGGSIEAESEPGKGSTFTVRLPGGKAPLFGSLIP